MAVITDPTAEVVKVCTALRIPNPQRAQAIRFGSIYAAMKHPKYVQGVTVRPDGTLYAPRSFFMEKVFDAGLCDGHRVVIQTAHAHARYPSKLGVEPYEHQQDALDALVSWREEDVSLCRPTDATIVMATSAGKTVLGMLIAHRFNLKTLVAVHSYEVEKAWIKDAKKVFGIDEKSIGRIRGKRIKIGEQFTVGSIQTLMNLDPKVWRGKFGLVVFDELHRHAANKFSKVAQISDADVRIGITATDSRKDGRMPCIRWHLGENVFKDVTPRNSVPLVYHAVASDQTFLPVSYDGNTPEYDYTNLVGQMSSSTERLERIVFLVEHVIAWYRGDIIVACDRVAVVKELVSMLVEKGISAAGLTGAVTGRIREELYEAICNSEYRVTVAMLSIISDGASNPYWHHVINTVAFSDPKTAEQLKGRPIRKMRDKKEGHFWDLVDNVKMLRNMGNTRYRALRKHIHSEVRHTMIAATPFKISP